MPHIIYNAIARAETKKEAEAIARKVLKPGYRRIVKQSGWYAGKRYNYLVCPKYVDRREAEWGRPRT